MLGIFSVGQVLMLFAFTISLNLCVITCCVPVGPLAQGDDNLVMRAKRTDCVIKMMLGIAGAHTLGGQIRAGERTLMTPDTISCILSSMRMGLWHIFTIRS